MKKVRILLAAIAVFAVVGTTMAFRAKYQDKFCTAAVPGDGVCAGVSLSCPNPFTGQVTTGTGTTYCFKATTGSCNSNTICDSKDKLTTSD